MHHKNLISHHPEQEDSFAVTVERIAQRIKKTGDLPHVNAAKQLELLDELTLFPFGRFLLENRGVNGYWTHYMVMHPQKGRKTGLNSEGRPFTRLEKFLLDHAPTVLATQQRFVYFQASLQQAIKINRKIASIPCGLMGDLLTLDFSLADPVKLVGIDLDQESLNAASELASERNLLDNVELYRKDAWQLSVSESFNVITSNGLNIYEPDDMKVVNLYRQFYQALLPEGILITSFVTPPPNEENQSTTWDLSIINSDHLWLQRVIFSDIVQAQWQCFRTGVQTEKQLLEAGFSQVEFIYDHARMFPTAIARK